MVRPTDGSNADALELIVRYARHYTHGPEKQYDHLFFFSTKKDECDSLVVFGGRVYRQYGGWCWFLGNRKGLIALSKLLESRSDLSNELKTFVGRMQRHFEVIYET